MVTTVRADVAHARLLLVEALGIVEEIGSRRSGQSLLEAVAGVATAAEEWTAAARSYGASEKEAAQYGLQRDRADEAFLSEQMAKVRVAITADEFGKAEAAGRALSYEQALAEARVWLESSAVR
jgi:hypothetical protein